MTKQQGKSIFAVLAIFIASYVIRTIVNATEQYENYQRQQQLAERRRQAKAKAAAAKPKPIATPAVAPAAPPSQVTPRIGVAPKVPPLPPRSPLNGVWLGQTALQGRGLCTMKLELREKDPGAFSGFSSTTCASLSPLMAAKDRNNARTALINDRDPDSALLSGALQNGEVHFKVDKTIGNDINGCSMTAYTVTPFGNGQVAAEWESGTCAGGHVIMRRIRQ